MFTHSIPRGRRRMLDRTKKRLLCDAVSRGATMAEAAATVGVSLRTVQRECRLDSYLDEQLRLAHGDKADPLAIMQSAARTHRRAAAWLLERQQPEDYGRRPASSASPNKFVAGLNLLIEAALEGTAPELRAALFERLEAARERAFECVFPEIGAWGQRAPRRLPSTPLADHQEAELSEQRQVLIFVYPSLAEAQQDEPCRQATPGRHIVQIVPSPDERAFRPAVVNVSPPTAPSGERQPLVESVSDQTPIESASDPSDPTLTRTRIPPAPAPTSRLPWRYLLRAARTAPVVLTPSCASRPSASILSFLSPKTRSATELGGDHNPLAASPHSAPLSPAVE